MSESIRDFSSNSKTFQSWKTQSFFYSRSKVLDSLTFFFVPTYKPLIKFESPRIEFNRTSSSQDEAIPQNLENFIEYVSRTGTYIFPWNLVKKLFLKKLTNIINNLQSCMSLSTSDMNTSSSSSHLGSQSLGNDANNIQLIKDRIIERMKSFTRYTI